MRILVTAFVVAAVIAPLPAQQLTGLRAEWSDLQTWSTDIGNTREQEVGLGLHLSGSSGGTLLAFIARVNTRRPDTAPDEIVTQVAIGSLTNPNVVRQPTLSFVIDAETDKRSSLELSGRLVVDDAAAGGSMQNGVAVFPAAEFARLAGAETLSADVLGFDVDFRPDQIRAMKDFAERLHLDTSP